MGDFVIDYLPTLVKRNSFVLEEGESLSRNVLVCFQPSNCRGKFTTFFNKNAKRNMAPALLRKIKCFSFLEKLRICIWSFQVLADTLQSIGLSQWHSCILRPYRLFCFRLSDCVTTQTKGRLFPSLFPVTFNLCTSVHFTLARLLSIAD